MTAGAAAPGAAQLALRFACTPGGRTVLAQRQVRYPHHVTAPLAGHDDALLVVQSASGGLYGGEQLQQQVVLDAGARVTLRFPSATVVHAARAQAAVQQGVVLQLGEGAALRYLQRPLILLPGARLVQTLQASVAAGAQLLWCEGVMLHTPGPLPATLAAPPGRSFDTRLVITDAAGRPRVVDRFCLDDAMLDAAVPGVTGSARAFGALWWVGSLPDGAGACWRAAAQAVQAGGSGLSVGTSSLPHGMGLVLRVAARDGGDLAAALDTLLAMLAPDRASAAQVAGHHVAVGAGGLEHR
ncbi:MAG: urease accessory protein UreD [Aquabacterium sp.]|nr:urease accessory protein UreD [Aquabacterium sp.]